MWLGRMLEEGEGREEEGRKKGLGRRVGGHAVKCLGFWKQVARVVYLKT